MLLTKTNGSLLLQSNTTAIYCDPVYYTSELDGKLIIITHLYPSLLNVLKTLSSNTTIYLSLDLLFLLQKLHRFFDFEKLPLIFKTLPCAYSIKLGDIQLTAENSDDSLYGSIVVLLQDQKSSIGYAPIFDAYGKHKKRIKKWKKKWSLAHLDLLIINSSLLTLDAQHHSPDFDSQKDFNLFVSKLQPSELAYVRFSPWNPELLLSFNEIALKNNYHIIWPLKWKNFLQSFSPYTNFDAISQENNDKKIYFSTEVKVTNYYKYYYELPSPLPTISKQSWTEIANFINAKAIKLL